MVGIIRHHRAAQLSFPFRPLRSQNMAVEGVLPHDLTLTSPLESLRRALMRLQFWHWFVSRLPVAHGTALEQTSRGPSLRAGTCLSITRPSVLGFWRFQSPFDSRVSNA